MGAVESEISGYELQRICKIKSETEGNFYAYKTP